MNCKIAEKNIQHFLDDELDNRLLKEFIEHISTCPNCKEELSIQYLVTEGLNVLETGDSFDLKNALNYKLINLRHQLRIYNRLLWIRNALMIIVCGASVYFGWMLYMYK